MGFETGLTTIVVATDLQGRSEGALEYARKLAGAYGARVVLAHGMDPMEYAAVDTVPGQVKKELTEAAQAVLDELSADLIREGIRSHSEIRQGAVTQMLVDVARQYEAGLIVVGTKGRLGAGPIVVGTVAEQLVRLAPCPVLAVAADWNAGTNRPTPGGAVMLAAEKNEATKAAVATALSLAETFERPLLVVHARAAEGGAGSDPCKQTLADFGIMSADRAQVRCIVKDGQPTEAIAAAIEEFHPSILVLGVKRMSGTPGPHGTAFQLLARSRVPVLCVPPELAPEAMSREVCVPIEAD